MENLSYEEIDKDEGTMPCNSVFSCYSNFQTLKYFDGTLPVNLL